MGYGVQQLPQFDIPQDVNIQDSLAKVTKLQNITPEKSIRMRAAAAARDSYRGAHELTRNQYRQQTYDNQPKNIFGMNKLYKNVEDAPVNPYSAIGDRQPIYQSTQHPATVWARYNGTGDGYSGFNRYLGAGYGLAGVGLGGLAARGLGRSALLGGGLGGLIGLGGYGLYNYLSNRYKDKDKYRNPYGFGGSKEYLNTDPRVWGRYNPPTTYDASKGLYRTSSRQMKNVGGSQMGSYLMAGIGGIGGLALANLIGLRGGLGKGLFTLAGAGAGLYARHGLNRPGGWMDRNRGRVQSVKKFLDVEGPRDSISSDIRDPESYSAQGPR